MNDFEKAVTEYINRKKIVELNLFSDFYELCCKNLNLNDSNPKFYKSNKNKIQYRLRKMRDKQFIDWRRCGSGYRGKTDFGYTSQNSYTLFGFWDDV